MNKRDDDADSVTTDGREYHRLYIRATVDTTDIWIGDDHGHPVCTETGTLDVRLLPGFYTVQFKLSDVTFPIYLDAPFKRSESEIRLGPTCPKPEFRFYDHA